MLRLKLHAGQCDLYYMYILIIVQSLEPNLKGKAINTCPGEIVQQRLFPFHLLKNTNSDQESICTCENKFINFI